MRHLDAFSHSSSGSPNTCLRQFCERVGVPAFLTLHKTREGDTPVKEIKKYQCHIQSLPWSIITFFLHFLDFFDIFLFFLTFLHLCSGRSTYLLATAKKQADHPCNIHANIHSNYCATFDQITQDVLRASPGWMRQYCGMIAKRRGRS